MTGIDIWKLVCESFRSNMRLQYSDKLYCLGATSGHIDAVGTVQMNEYKHCMQLLGSRCSKSSRVHERFNRRGSIDGKVLCG